MCFVQGSGSSGLLKQDTNAAFKVLSVNEKENPYLVSLRQQIFNLNLMPFH